jgi:AcrR family transcriptional regulator
VGINKASFYYHFKNKEDIFTALIEEEAIRFIRATVNKANKIKTCKQRVLKWIRESFSYLQSNSILNQLSHESLKNLSPYIKGLLNFSKTKGIAYLAETLNHFMSRGEIKTINTQKTAETIQNVIYALKDYHHRQQSVQTAADETIRAVSLMLDGLIINRDER